MEDRMRMFNLCLIGVLELEIREWIRDNVWKEDKGYKFFKIKVVRF